MIFGLVGSATIHKSQGMGLDWAKLFIGARENAGSTYVAMSRLTTVLGMWLQAFDMQRLLRIGNSKPFRKRVQHDRALVTSVANILGTRLDT